MSLGHALLKLPGGTIRLLGKWTPWVTRRCAGPPRFHRGDNRGGTGGGRGVAGGVGCPRGTGGRAESRGDTQGTLIVAAAGVSSVVVAVNKMDETDWSRGRFDEVETAVRPVLRHLGFPDSAVR